MATEAQPSSDPFVPQLVGEALQEWAFQVQWAWSMIWHQHVRDDGRGEPNQAIYGTDHCSHGPGCVRCDPLGERARWIIFTVERLAGMMSDLQRERSGAPDERAQGWDRFDNFRAHVDQFFETRELIAAAVERVEHFANLYAAAPTRGEKDAIFDKMLGVLTFEIHPQFTRLLPAARAFEQKMVLYNKAPRNGGFGAAELLSELNKWAGDPLGKRLNQRIVNQARNWSAGRASKLQPPSGKKNPRRNQPVFPR